MPSLAAQAAVPRIARPGFVFATSRYRTTVPNSGTGTPTRITIAGRRSLAKEVPIAKSEGRPHAGPGFAKSPPELIDRFGQVTAGIEGIERRQMFGYPAAFANGYMFTGLHQANWVVRLPSDGLDELSAAGGRVFEPMPGRPMSGYLAFPRQMVAAGAPALLPWIERSLDFVRSLPPKQSARKSR